MSGTICEKCGAHVIDKRVNIEEKRKEKQERHKIQVEQDKGILDFTNTQPRVSFCFIKEKDKESS